MPSHCSNVRAGSMRPAGRCCSASSPRSLPAGRGSGSGSAARRRARTIAAVDRRPCAACAAARDARQERPGSIVDRARAHRPAERAGPMGGRPQPGARSGRFRGARGSGCPCSGCGLARGTLISPFEAIAAAELNQADRADRLFETMVPADRGSIALWHVRHLIRSGRPDRRSPSSSGGSTDLGPSFCPMRRSLGV